MGDHVSKKYHIENNSKIIIASPYGVSWDDDFFISTVLKVEVTYGEDDGDYEDGENIDSTEIVEEGEKETYTELHTMAGFWELKYMEQIKILEEPREGKEIAQKSIKREKEILEINSYKKPN